MHAEPNPARSELLCPHCRGALGLREGAQGPEVYCSACHTAFAFGAAAAVPLETAPPEPAPAPGPLEEYLPEFPLSPTFLSPIESADVAAGEVKITDVVIPFSDLRGSRPRSQVPRSSLLSMTGQEGYTEVRREASPPPPAAVDSDPIEVETRIPHVNPQGEADYLALAAERGILAPLYEPDPPPRWTFFSGVLSFPFGGESGFRFGIMALGWSALFFSLFNFSRQDSATQVELVGGILIALTMAAGVAFMAMYSAACMLAAIIDTGNGSDRVQSETMPEVIDWVFNSLRLLFLWILTAALVYPLTYVPQIGTLFPTIVAEVAFPIMLLSALEANSFLVPYSPPVLRTLVRSAWVWITFFVLAGLLWRAWGEIAWYGATGLPAWAGGPLVGANLAYALLVYARLLGRLGWRISLVQPKKKRAKAMSGALSTRRLPPELDAAVDLLG